LEVKAMERELKAIERALNIMAAMERELNKLHALVPEFKGTHIAPLFSHYRKGLEDHLNEFTCHLEAREAELLGED
jgi:hypothetical protein